MSLIRSIMLGMTLAFAAGVAGSAFAAEEKKCDAAGKECKEGKDCKAENCKKEKPKA